MAWADRRTSRGIQRNRNRVLANGRAHSLLRQKHPVEFARTLASIRQQDNRLIPSYYAARRALAHLYPNQYRQFVNQERAFLGMGPLK